MTTAMTIYLCMFAIGFVFLAISFGFGFDFEIDHEIPGGDHGVGDHSDSPSIFSAKVISCFLMGFGAFASIGDAFISQNNMDSGSKFVLAGLVGIVGGFLMGYIGWLIIKLFLGQQGNSNYSLEMFIGMKAQLSVPISEGGIGEISCNLRGQRRSLDVRSTDGKAIMAGTMVEVIQVTGSTRFILLFMKILRDSCGRLSVRCLSKA